MVLGLYQGFDYPILLKASDRGLAEISFLQKDFDPDTLDDSPNEAFNNQYGSFYQQLDDYFQGKEVDFDVPLDIRSGTPFQRTVWDYLRKIPYGQTRSYGEIARSIGKPGSQRAIGQANGANPLPIIIPCHRVVAADHKLGGYSAGVEIKRALLSIERVSV
jgi:methylated-DNA-[protein]-cysteine S-methyltransferase